MPPRAPVSASFGTLHNFGVSLSTAAQNGTNARRSWRSNNPSMVCFHDLAGPPRL